jgi:hypothetical protein
MLLSSLLLMFVACPVQDPPIAPATRPATQEAAPADAQPAMPTETPENVRSFLSEAQSHLYDPQAAGLKSLAFDMDIDLPQPMGHVGAVHVTWAAGQPAQTVFTAAEGLNLPPQVPQEMIEAQSNATAQQLLGGMLNRTIASLLDEGVATMAGVQEGLVAVSHYLPAAAAQGVTSQIYLFDEDGKLQKSTTVVKQQGMTINVVQNYSWKPAGEGTALLVAEAQSVEADFGIMKQSSNASFTYTQVGAIVLPTRIATSSKGPMSGDQIMAARNLVVNGEATPVSPAPAESAPAAPREPAGG